MLINTLLRMSNPGLRLWLGYSKRMSFIYWILGFKKRLYEYSGNLLKPSLDIILFTSQLSRSLGLRGTILLFLNYYTTAAVLKAVTPAFGRLAAVEARLEGEYRNGMGRVGRDGEEIA